ncbi:hypothetical protein J6590_027743 [Homalodisca vitripennis]|nr:hypothetical protein J6590_027743 [Homalodisca vitripennis]
MSGGEQKEARRSEGREGREEDGMNGVRSAYMTPQAEGACNWLDRRSYRLLQDYITINITPKVTYTFSREHLFCRRLQWNRYKAKPGFTLDTASAHYIFS